MHRTGFCAVLMYIPIDQACWFCEGGVDFELLCSKLLHASHAMRGVERCCITTKQDVQLRGGVRGRARCTAG
jgi:hypothetical protein